MKSLIDLNLGEFGNIINITCDNSIKQRLLDLGLVPTTIITPVLKSPSNTTVAYEFRGSTIALRNDDAKFILIEQSQF